MKKLTPLLTLILLLKVSSSDASTLMDSPTPSFLSPVSQESTGLDKEEINQYLSSEYKLSFIGHLSTKYENPSSLYGGEISFSIKLPHSMWWGFQLSQTTADFKTITQNHPVVSNSVSGSESSLQRPSESKTTLLQFGVGVGYRFQVFPRFSSQVFETVEVFAQRVNMNDSFINKKYNGWGLSTQFGLHKRIKDHFYYGGKFTYHLSQVSRERIDAENKSQRSFSIGWTSVGLDFGFFF